MNRRESISAAVSLRPATDAGPARLPRLSLRRWLLVNLANVRLAVPRIAGPAFVLGSAPEPQLPRAYSPAWSLVTVNASQVVGEKMGLPPPALTLIRPGILVGNLDSDRYKRQLLAGKRTRVLVVPSHRQRGASLERGCDTFDYRFDSLVVLNDWQIAKIENRMCAIYLSALGGWENSCSTGVQAIMMACFLGANPVVVSGVSLSAAGHAYDDRNAPRYHVSGDARVLEAARARALPIFTTDQSFASETGLPVWSGD